MNLPVVELPSNQKFGFFFSAIFLIASIYFIYLNYWTTGCVLAILGILFFIIVIIKAELLLPLNNLWMRFGLLLGIIISPVVLGIIFFGLFTPYSVIMKLIGRDELRLKKVKNISHWILRSKTSSKTNFKQQF